MRVAEGSGEHPAGVRTVYHASRIVIDGAFSTAFHGWDELALALGWLAVPRWSWRWRCAEMLGSTA